MSLQDVPVKNEYRSLIDNVVQDFYLPLLKEATVYKRAVGFFSSSSLVEISKGIAKMASSGGKIQIVASPLWGDRIFEKCGIRRDEGGDGGKTLEIRGKRRLSARDGGANYQQS